MQHYTMPWYSDMGDARPVLHSDGVYTILLMRRALHPLGELGKKLSRAITSGIVAEAKALAVQTLEEYQQQVYMDRCQYLPRMVPNLKALLDPTRIATFKGLKIVFDNYSAKPQEEPHTAPPSIPGRILHAFINLVKKDAALKASEHYYELLICPHGHLWCCCAAESCLLSKSADGPDILTQLADGPDILTQPPPGPVRVRPDILTQLAAAFCLLTRSEIAALR